MSLKEETQDLLTGNNALDKQLVFKQDLGNMLTQFSSPYSFFILK